MVSCTWTLGDVFMVCSVFKVFSLNTFKKCSLFNLVSFGLSNQKGKVLEFVSYFVVVGFPFLRLC